MSTAATARGSTARVWWPAMPTSSRRGPDFASALWWYNWRSRIKLETGDLMRRSAVIQLLDEEPIVGELEGLPDPSAQFVTVLNPRRRDGRAVAFLDNNVETVLFAWHRISNIQLLPDVDIDKVITFVRE